MAGGTARASRFPAGSRPLGAVTTQPHLHEGQGGRPGYGHAAECPRPPPPPPRSPLVLGSMARVLTPLPVTRLPGYDVACPQSRSPFCPCALELAGRVTVLVRGSSGDTELRCPGPSTLVPSRAGAAACAATPAHAQDGVAESGDSPGILPERLSLSAGTTSASGRRCCEGRRRPSGSRPSRWTRGPPRSCP